MTPNERKLSKSEAVARLTPGQLDCLRLVLTRHSSKEIAQEVGVSPHTVDQRLRIAMQTLGVSSRFEAARIVFDAEAPAPYQRSVYQGSHIAELPQPAPPADRSHQQGGGGNENGEVSSVEERWAAEQGVQTPSRQPNRLPIRDGSRNDLTPSTRLIWVLALLVGLVIAVGTFISAAESLGRIYRTTAL